MVTSMRLSEGSKPFGHSLGEAHSTAWMHSRQLIMERENSRAKKRGDATGWSKHINNLRIDLGWHEQRYNFLKARVSPH